MRAGIYNGELHTPSVMETVKARWRKSSALVYVLPLHSALDPDEGFVIHIENEKKPFRDLNKLVRVTHGKETHYLEPGDEITITVKVDPFRMYACDFPEITDLNNGLG